MEAALIGVVGVVLGAIAGGLVTYLTTRSRMRLELEYAHDRELRDKRLSHYQRLFHVSRAVPREWRPDAVPSRAELRRIREEFHGWYFGEDAGGMFLTDRARDLYFRLQNGLEATSGQRGHEEDPLTVQEQELLYKLASALRHQLSADVGTAQAPRLEWAPPGGHIAPAVTVRGPLIIPGIRLAGRPVRASGQQPTDPLPPIGAPTAHARRPGAILA